MQEADIQRYGRQILLKELGGRGQRALMEARVELHGSRPALDDAVTYLRAGGTPVSTAPGTVVLSTMPGVETDKPLVVVGEGVAFRAAGTCDDCWRATLAALPPASSPHVTAGTLAALCVQRLILGWSEPIGLVLTGARLTAPVTPRCPQHR